MITLTAVRIIMNSSYVLIIITTFRKVSDWVRARPPAPRVSILCFHGAGEGYLSASAKVAPVQPCGGRLGPMLAWGGSRDPDQDGNEGHLPVVKQI